MDTFGEWLRLQRNNRKLTRDEFAKRVGCSIALLRKIEDGERRPSVQIAELIAGCLNIPLEQRPTLVKVARGELGVDRLTPLSKPNDASVSQCCNLPVFPTPLIGRQREVEELSQLLLDPQCRILNLVGPGGIGKTRLAIETASLMQDAFTDGVYFVPLAPVTSTRFLVPVIADVIGFAFESSSRADLKSQLFNYLKEKQVLLLLDSLEHLLVEPGIELLAEVLANTSQVRLLTTSRESLGLQGEWVFEVEGLPVPISEPAENNVENTSVELFLQRARRANVRFNTTVEDYSAIVRICQLVDGMPLGIELAAAWVRTLACDEIAREIESGLDFLSVTTRDLPTRHRSMRAVFNQSWSLLSEAEQTILFRLSEFRGGFRREAAEVVAGTTVTALSLLVTKSLIRRSGSGRYDLHELIRQFTAEQFAERPDEQIATQARHGKYYLKYFNQANARLRSSAHRETLSELTAEMDNFRAAWDWAVTHGEFALIEQTMHLFVWFYDCRGWFQEGLDILGGAIEALETAHKQLPFDRTDLVALAHILTARSLLAYRLAHYEQAKAMLERSLEILRPLNEPRVLGESVYFLGQVLDVTGDYSKALELYSEGVEIAKAIDDRWYTALCLINLNGLVAITHVSEIPENPHARLQSAVADCRLIGDPRLIAFGLRMLSQSALTLERYDEARGALEESAALSITIGDRWGLGTAYRGLGVVAQAQGEHIQAVNMFQKSLETFTELGGSWWVARVLADKSRSVFELGNVDEARRIWRDSLRIATENHGTPVALEALAGFASLHAEQGNMEYALELLLVVLNHSASFKETKNRASDLRSDLEAQLSPTQIEAIQARAGEKNFEAVVADLLN
jgi:predicted ATPase/transcriptional regulator with XRE-family HTH domain